MAGFTIPNTPDAYNQNQAEPDSLDFQILGNQTNAVITGVEVTPGPSGATVAVSSGEVIVGGVYYPVTAVGSLSLTAYASSPFFDIVVARLSSGSISVIVLPGTSGANPVYPAITANDVVLAAVWRPSNTTPTSSMIVDKRLLVPSTTNRVASGNPSSGAGSTGESYVNSSWSSDSTLASPLSVKVGGTWYQLARYSSNFTAGTVTASSFVGPLTGAVTGTASSATLAVKASTLSQNGGNGAAMTFNWSGQGGQPTWLWGSNDGANHYVYNPSNFSVSYATSAGSANSATTATDAVTADYINGGTNVDPLGGEYIGYSNTFAGWTVQGNFRVTSVNFYATGLGTTGSASNVRVLGDGRLAISTSLRQYKESIEDIPDALSTINSLRPRTFKFKPTESDGPVERYLYENSYMHGFIVEEVLESTPDLIDYTVKDDQITPQMWRTNDLIALLTRSVQQLSARIEALEAGNG